MADVIGTVASVITLAQVVIELIKHAKTFYRAQAEFDVLHVCFKSFKLNFLAELENFRHIIVLFETRLIFLVWRTGTTRAFYGIVK
jgi:hypothetical protein